MEIFDINNNSKQSRQSQLFDSKINTSTNLPHTNSFELKRETIMLWRNKIYHHQSKILENKLIADSQQSLFPEIKSFDEKKINPFSLQPFSLSFWRTSQSVHQGPAMYYVIDNMANSKIILYIGETNSANKRWKGEHDCKKYLINYKEALASNNLESHQDIRFFLDVPKEVKLRRKLEHNLIYLWLPPFNKETRSRWSTTFTNN